MNVQWYVTPFGSSGPEAVSVKVFWLVSAPGRFAIVGSDGGAKSREPEISDLSEARLPDEILARSEYSYVPCAWPTAVQASHARLVEDSISSKETGKEQSGVHSPLPTLYSTSACASALCAGSVKSRENSTDPNGDAVWSAFPPAKPVVISNQQFVVTGASFSVSLRETLRVTKLK